MECKISGKDIENLIVNMVLEKHLIFFLNLKKPYFHSSLLENELNEIFVWNSSSDDYSL